MDATMELVVSVARNEQSKTRACETLITERPFEPVIDIGVLKDKVEDLPTHPWRQVAEQRVRPTERQPEC